MTRQYSIRKMFRQTPNPLLKQFFQRLNYELLCIDWRRLKHLCDDALMISIDMLPREARDEINARLADIHELAYPGGVQALVESARALGCEEFIRDLPKRGPYFIAMWSWLNFPLVFEYALTLVATDHLGRPRIRSELPRVEPRRNDAALRELARGVSNCLRHEEGRGDHCTVEHFARASGADIFIAYADDYAQTIAAHDARGRLKPRTIRPTFEVVFEYYRDDGLLKLYSPLRKRLKEKMETLFGQIILGEDIGPRPYNRPFHLNRLKDRYFCLETDPSDCLKASVSMLRLDAHGWGKITMDPHTLAPSHDVYDMIEHCLNGDALPWDIVDISQVKLDFTFRPMPGRRAGTVQATVTAPDHCNVRSGLPERVNLVHKYLKRWRIADVR